MSRSAALCFDDDTHASNRELRFGSSQERSALRTHLCCLAARLLFLLAHGLVVIAIAASLETIETGSANWWVIFLPAWIGNSLCGILLTIAWCVSCPYIKLCLSERQPRVRDNPSILTEVLPDIVLTLPGLAFIIVATCAEYSFCSYLISIQIGQPRSVANFTVLFSMLGLLAVCQGALFRDNSTLWLSLGAGLVASIFCLVALCQDDCLPLSKAMVLTPFVLAVASLLLAAAWRMWSYANVLKQDELMLLRIEAVLLTLLLTCLISVFAKVWQAKLGQAGVDGCFVGVLLCMLALPRAQLGMWEAKRGQLADRMFWQEAMPALHSSSLQV